MKKVPVIPVPSELNRIAKGLSDVTPSYYACKDRDRQGSRLSVVRSLMMGTFEDFTILGAGLGRVVYVSPRFPDVVFKVIKKGAELNQNRVEYNRYYQQTTARQRMFLAQPYELIDGGTMLVMERIHGTVLQDAPVTLQDKYADRLNNLYSALQHSDGVYISDLHYENIMITPRGKVRAVDYGFH